MERMDTSTNSGDNNVSIFFCWNRIAQNFEQKFSEVFATSKKAHFDCLPPEYKVIDGARTRWANLLLLDAMVYFVGFEDFNFFSRRTFNQQKELYDCIMSELLLIDPTFHHELQEYKGDPSRESLLDVSSLLHLNENHLLSTLPALSQFTHSPRVALSPLEDPWSDFPHLRHFLLQDQPSKSRLKFLAIIDLLCAHEHLGSCGFDLGRVVEVVLLKVLFLFGKARNPALTVLTPRVPGVKKRPNFTPSPHGVSEVEKWYFTRHVGASLHSWALNQSSSSTHSTPRGPRGSHSRHSLDPLPRHWHTTQPMECDRVGQELKRRKSDSPLHSHVQTVSGSFFCRRTNNSDRNSNTQWNNQQDLPFPGSPSVVSPGESASQPVMAEFRHRDSSVLLSLDEAPEMKKDSNPDLYNITDMDLHDSFDLQDFRDYQLSEHDCRAGNSHDDDDDDEEWEDEDDRLLRFLCSRDQGTPSLYRTLDKYSDKHSESDQHRSVDAHMDALFASEKGFLHPEPAHLNSGHRSEHSSTTAMPMPFAPTATGSADGPSGDFTLTSGGLSQDGLSEERISQFRGTEFQDYNENPLSLNNPQSNHSSRAAPALSGFRREDYLFHSGDNSPFRKLK